jgi:hypothetical protein
MEMKLLADTNWLVAAYFRRLDPQRTALVDRFSERNDLPWWIPSIGRLECENMFRLIGGSSLPPELITLQGDIGMRVRETEESWGALSNKARELFQRFSRKTRVGTLDMMILASGLKAEATHLLSFDTKSNLRALASLLKLKVVPDLTAEDKRRMAAFR